MNILGISSYYHDSAAAILKDGHLIAASAEERFNRIKHYNGFPRQAILFCLQQAKLTPGEIDYIAFYDKPFVKFDRILTSFIANFPKSREAFVQVIPVWLKERLLTKEKIGDLLGDVPVIFSEHHLSHAASAFFVSPFKESAIMTVDGVGEWTTSALGFGNDREIHLGQELRFPHSLGLLYNAVTAYLGFRVNSDEWKVMGLAPYGRSIYKSQLEKLILLNADGSFKLNMKYFSFDHSFNSMFNNKFEELFGAPKREPEEPITQFHQNVAASAQAAVETVLIMMAKHLRGIYDTKNLCIAGGVGLNCVANWKILKQAGFENVFVQPASGDDGAALGAAFFVHHQLLKHKRDFVMRHAYWGPEYADEEIEQYLKNKGANFEKLDTPDLIDKASGFIVKDKIIAWFQGRTEWGPRALGNRSILANPLNPGMREMINAKVKNRENFRPFAASVLEESSAELFEFKESPFMMFAVPGKPGTSDIISSVVHVDGTSRIQTVSEADNLLFYSLIKRVGEKNGIPVVLNTSFNYAEEPIVCSPDDAYRCFMKTAINYLFLGHYLVTK